MLNTEVAKSSTSFGWGKGGNATSVGWQVTLYDPVWHVSFRSVVWQPCELLYTCYLYLLTSATSTGRRHCGYSLKRLQMPGVGSRRLVNTVHEGLVKHNGQCVGGQRGEHVSVHSNIALDGDHSHCSAAGSMMAPGVHRPLQIVARPPKLAVLLTLQIP